MEIRLQIDDRLVTIFRRTLTIATGRRAALLVASLVLASALVAAAAPASKPHEFVAGKPASAAEVNENFDALFTAIADRTIGQDQTISVSADQGCDGLVNAVSDLDDRSIGSSATVTIELAPGTYPCAETVTIHHPQGARLHIVGGGDDPSQVQLTFSGATTGIRLSQNDVLGGLENLTLQGGDTTPGVGIVVRTGASIKLNKVTVRDFGTGISAESHGLVTGIDVTTESNAADGVRSVSGYVALTNAVSTGNAGAGFVVYEHGTLELTGPSAVNNGTYGFAAETAGFLRYFDAVEVTGNTPRDSELTLGTADPTGAVIISTGQSVGGNPGTRPPT